MPEKIFKTRIQHKIDTTANWASSSLILKNGEIGVERTTNNKIKIKIGDGTNTWANLPYATNESSSSSSGGIEYEAGDGISIEEGIISSSYGKTIQQQEIFNCLPFTNSTNINFNENFYYGLENASEDFHVNQMFIAIPFKYFSNITKPFSIIFKKNNTIIKTINLSLGPVTIYANTENETVFSYAAMGNEYFVRAIASEGEDTDAIAMLMDENNPIPITDWWVAVIANEDEPEKIYYQFIYQAHEDLLPLDIDEIELQLFTNTIQKLPSEALNAGNGIRIGANAKIELDYGLTNEDQFVGNTLFDLSSGNNPAGTFAGNLYAYYVSNILYGMEANNNPGGVFSYINNLQCCWGWPSSTTTNLPLNYEYQSTIDYATNSYYAIPFFFMNNNLIQEPNIICKELPYTDNMLYTLFSAGLDTDNPTKNIFFAGGYNTNTDVNTAFTNGVIEPINSEKIAFLVILLYRTFSNTMFFTIFSNQNNLSNNYSNYSFKQGTVTKIYNHLPYNIFDGTGNTKGSNATTSFCIGDNNSYNSNQKPMIIIGDNNNFTNGGPTLAIGNYLTSTIYDTGVLIGQYNASSNDYSYLTIGNGFDNNTRSNLLEITNNGVNINTNLYVHGIEVQGGNGTGGSLNTTDLENYLNNNNYITSSYLTTNNYITDNSLATVATSGSYNDLLYKPTIPTMPTIATSITNTSTNNDTAGAAAVYNFVTNAVAGLSGAMHFIGTTTTALADGAITEPVVIDSNDIYPVAGDVVLNNGNEYVYTGVEWHKLGDESSWVPQLRTINGKALSSNITLDASDVGALPNTTTLATLNGVPTTRTINGKSLNSDITLTANDVNALSINTIFNLAEAPTSNNTNNIQIYQQVSNGNVTIINHNPTENELFLYGLNFYKKVYNESINKFFWQSIHKYNLTFTVDSSSTDYQIPTAKAVYDAIQTALGNIQT